ncbi:Mismatch repair ATPase (MutS family)-like protein [Lachnoclostridium phytofermentans ISDg]|uniref:Mismatch repair ATPase (MutS family)-like protein n=1 Tax=Lachnoclostridium phytofermentans (strain ATCC 700394 / DSM 18823 / ISDg) TaxID=357809 RepID=A9KII0_LACP7|nr:Mismatch repair ATPase (MutS family)-like protein [Lachnoclostridium phytofermentans ISDg]
MTILIILAITILVLWSIHKRKRKRNLILIHIQEAWENISPKDNSSTDLEILREEYKTYIANKNSIDELTWCDLEMDKVFLKMNFTSSMAGESYLYELLHKPLFEEDELTERNRVIEILTNSSYLRTKLQYSLSVIGKSCSRSLYDYLLNCEELKTPNKWPHIISAIFLFISVALIFYNRTIGILLCLIAIILSLVTYFKDRAAMESDLPLVRIVGNMLMAAKELSQMTDTNLSCYFNKIKVSQKLCKQFKITIRAISSGVTSFASDMDIVSDYLRILTHIDIFLYNSYIKKLKASYKELILIYQIVGFLDSMVAIAKYRKNQLYFCTPNFTDTLSIVTTDIYHPLINTAVANDFTGTRSTLFTGTNASGKSTFLRTLGINALLAQTIYTVHATRFETNFYHIHTSISLKDDLEQHESYYMAEIKALK